MALDEEVEKAGAPVLPAGGEWVRLPLFYERLDTLFDYLGDDALIAFDHQRHEVTLEMLKTMAGIGIINRRNVKGKASARR